MSRKTWALALMVGLFGAGGATQAAIVDFEPLTDLGLSPGDRYRYVFVTSTARDATSSDIAVYNAFVQSAANASTNFGGSGITWKAIGSTVETAAYDNIGGDFSELIFTVPGDLVASGSAALWDSNIHSAISSDENGIVSDTLVWTGTSDYGSRSLLLPRFSNPELRKL